ncbi:MAG: hypothetical protein QJR12_16815 [Mycobacterium sp.]|uniref:hypothetical protein n=1 Tax=Mycobacterium sp. TaxID=1785 RepID=UPI002615A214|nr:hypothetical protein [Mycobacterium sp.]MDI3315869.1 hypothetical protein [Mycobacterium sp.]
MKCTGRVTIKGPDGRIQRDADGKPLTRPCKADAVRGATVCNKHGGAAPQVKARAAVRAEVMAWGLGDEKVDPGEILLRLVSQSAARAERYAVELEALVDEHGGDIQKAMIADTIMLDRDGQPVKVGEYIRGLAELEAKERDRCANFAAKAVAAGLAERQVRIAERQAEAVLKAIDAALDAAGIAPADRGPAKLAAARHLKAV